MLLKPLLFTIQKAVRSSGAFIVIFPILILRLDQLSETAIKQHIYRTEVNNGRKRIEIWKKDVYLDPGSYTYQIQYLTDQQIEDLRQLDRLYWNVTGQDWAFPIQKVEAEVILPEGIPSDDITLSAFTGYQGEQGKSYEANLEGKKAKFTTTRSLKKGQGLSVIVNLPKGFVESTESVDRSTFAEQESSDTASESSFPASMILYFVFLIMFTVVLLILSRLSGEQDRSSRGSRGGGGGAGGTGGGGGA